MKEYKVLSVDPLSRSLTITDLLNRYASEGWELLIWEDQALSTNLRLVLTREKLTVAPREKGNV